MLHGELELDNSIAQIFNTASVRSNQLLAVTLKQAISGANASCQLFV